MGAWRVDIRITKVLIKPATIDTDRVPATHPTISTLSRRPVTPVPSHRPQPTPVHPAQTTARSAKIRMGPVEVRKDGQGNAEEILLNPLPARSLRIVRSALTSVRRPDVRARLTPPSASRRRRTAPVPPSPASRRCTAMRSARSGR